MSDDAIHFGQFRLDLTGQRLSRNGVPVALGSRAFAILRVLASAKGEVVTKDQLMAEVWHGRVVEENNIQVHISALRRALDEGSDGKSHVVTVPRRGYRLVEVNAVSSLSSQLRPVGIIPSIAVLPLRNLGNDPADDYFCDGCVEDIIISLAGLGELIVISRGSTLAYRGSQPDPCEVGRNFGVRYVLCGSLRRSGQVVRVSVELCDTDTGATLWGEREEVTGAEIFDVQDRIVRKIVNGIAPNVRAAGLRTAMRKKPEHFSAYDCMLRALHVMNSIDRITFMQARDFLQNAMEQDPDFAMPFAIASRWHSLYVGQGWSVDPAADRAKALQLAAKAIEQDSKNALALGTYGHLQSLHFHNYDRALVFFERALAACPNHSLAWALSAPTLSYIGRGKQAVEHAEQALSLSPLDRGLFSYFTTLNLAHYAQGSYDEAVKWGKLSASENPHYIPNLRYLAAALAALNRLDEARNIAMNLIQRDPEFRLSTFKKTMQPFRDPGMSSRYLQHLKKSGLPD